MSTSTPATTPTPKATQPSRPFLGSQLVTLGVSIALIAAIVVLAALHDLTPPAAGLLGVLVGGHGIIAAGNNNAGSNTGG